MGDQFINSMRVLVCVLALFVGVFAAPGDLGARIVGGSQAPRGLYPYIVTAQYCNAAGASCQHTCGGTILTESFVLTAGHCITEVSGTGQYFIIAGITYLNDTNPERQRIRVVEEIVHPQYVGGVAPHDLALFRLEEPIQYSNLAQPISLPASGVRPTGNVQLVGWGSIGTIIIFPIMPNELYHVSIPVISIEDCRSALDEILGNAPHPLDNSANICTGPLNAGISACSGDSGGPLVNENGEIVGITSWGINPCGTVGAPSVFVNVSNYVQWINQNIS